jgi:hypothetical protein
MTTETMACLAVDPLYLVRKIFNVTNIRCVAFKEIPIMTAPVNELGSWEVSSSRDASVKYTVVRKSHDKFICDCPGYIFNHKCKHVTAKKKAFGLI